MKRFFVYLLVVFLLVCVLDIVNRFLCDFMYDRIPVNSELYREYNYVTNKKQADILILGASRGVYSYNVDMISDSLHMHCISASNEGMSIFHQYLNLLRACQNGSVSFVILDLSPAQLSTDWVRNKISVLYPFYWKDKNVREIVRETKGWYSDIILCSSFIQYNSTFIDYIHKGYFMPALDNDGYIPIEYTGKSFVFHKTDNDKTKIEVDTLGIKYLDKIVEYCKNKDIALVICNSPRLNNVECFDTFLTDYTNRRHVPFWNYSKYAPVVMDNRLFVDPLHINCKGTDIFTEEIVRKIKENI